MDLVVASNLEHANALAGWPQLDPEKTETLTYGRPVLSHYHNVYLARPLGGVEESHTRWAIEELKPRVYGRVIPMAPCWRLSS